MKNYRVVDLSRNHVLIVPFRWAVIYKPLKELMGAFPTRAFARMWCKYLNDLEKPLDTK